jgi:MFS superfamily sulfate permease-like transporter
LRIFDPKTFASDFLASIVVFLVALPLCMGIAIASGVPPALGLISGIVGGLVVGFLAGCPLQVSGPAAGLAVMVYEMIQAHGIAMLGPLVLMAGIIQLVAGLLKAGQLFRAISPAVIYGMLAGIGVLIFGSQFHVMVDDKPKGNGLLNLLTIPQAVYKGLFPLDGSSHHVAAFIGVTTIVVLIAWNQFAPKKLKWIPGALVSVVVATVVSAAWSLPIRYVDIPANLLSAVTWFTPSDLPGMLLQPALWLTAFALAFVASAETLLCATAVDQMHDGPKTKYDRELMAQGVGNLLCGFVGALPMTGVIVRSATNVAAGAKTRLSAILHGGWLLGLVVALPFVLKLVPTASLAAILVFTGYKLVNPQNIQRLLRYGGLPVFVYAATVIGIVTTDLLKGIMIGLALSFLKLIYALTHLRVTVQHDAKAKRADVYLDGVATFIRLPKLADTLDELPLDHEVHVHFRSLDYIDHACVDLLSGWEKQRSNKGSRVFVEWDELMGMYKQQNSLAGPQQRSAPEANTEIREEVTEAVR